MSTVLRVNDLTTSLLIEGKECRVVDGVNFDLKEGTTLALVGESGCGKSMTAHSILRLLPTPPALPSKGEVFYRNKNLLTLPEREMRLIRGRHIAMIFQDPMSAFNPVYTLGNQLMEVVVTHLGLEGEDAYEKVIQSFEEVHLPSPEARFQEYPYQMSGGMLQRALIAMALICEPDVLIADEPTTSLDVTTQAQILTLLKELQEKKGMATILITHNMGVVAEMADEVVVMYATRQIEQAKVADLFDYPSHPYTQALFASRPDRPMREGKLPTIEGSVPRINQMPKGCHFHPRCPYALDICQTKKVPNFTLPGRDHQVKCWLFDKELEWKLDDEE